MTYRTANLQSCILYIYSTNVGTEYFKHGLYSPFCPLQNTVCFIILTCLVPVLFTFIYRCAKIKKKLFRRQNVNNPPLSSPEVSSEESCKYSPPCLEGMLRGDRPQPGDYRYPQQIRMHPYADQYGALPRPRDPWLKVRGWKKQILKNAYTVIPRLTKIIRSGITFVSRKKVV